MFGKIEAEQRQARWKEKERGVEGTGFERGTHPSTEMLSAQSIITTLFLPTAESLSPDRSLAETASQRSNGGEGMDRGRIIQAGTIFFCESEITRARLRPPSWRYPLWTGTVLTLQS